MAAGTLSNQQTNKHIFRRTDRQTDGLRDTGAHIRTRTSTNVGNPPPHSHAILSKTVMGTSAGGGDVGGRRKMEEWEWR